MEFCEFLIFALLFSKTFSFLVFWIKFRKTKQIVVTFVATALKPLLSVAKTNVRLSGRKLYTGNIYYLLFKILTHKSPYQHTKRCATEATHPKKHKPLLLRNKPLTNRRIIHIHKDGTCTFYQIQIFADAKRQSTPYTEKYS